MRSSVVLTIASLAFVVPGIIRTKASAHYFGVEGIALFGQLSQTQTVLIAIGGAGLVTATRVVLSRPTLEPIGRDQVHSWLLYVPTLFAIGIAALVALAAPTVSDLVLGTPVYAGPVRLAALGLPFAVMAQVAIAGSQARGERWNLVLGAGLSAIFGGLSTVLLMASGDTNLAASSLTIAPAIQLCVILIVCRTSIRALRSKPRIEQKAIREVVMIAWASAVLGILAAVGDLITRSSVVQNDGLLAIAPYQPVALLVIQLVGIGLSAISTSSLIALASVQGFDVVSSRIGEYLFKLIPVIATLTALILSASPLLIQLFFTGSLVQSALPLVAIALAGETVRASVWIAGAAFLPFGLRFRWLGAGVLTVGVQVAVSLLTIPILGVMALPVGFVSGNCFAVIVTAVFLRSAGISVRPAAFFIGPLLGVGLYVSYLIGPAAILGVLVGPAVYCVALALYLLALVIIPIQRKRRLQLAQ